MTGEVGRQRYRGGGTATLQGRRHGNVTGEVARQCDRERRWHGKRWHGKVAEEVSASRPVIARHGAAWRSIAPHSAAAAPHGTQHVTRHQAFCTRQPVACECTPVSSHL